MFAFLLAVIISLIVVPVLLAVFCRFVYPGFPSVRKPGALKSTYGSWALITGASAGIGLEFATQLAKEGINVILVARRKDRLESIAKELSANHGIDARVVAADLGTREGPYNVHKAVAEMNLPEGGPGLIINNAGFGWFGKFQEEELKHIEDMIQLNVTSVAVLTRLFLDDLKNRASRGGIIITSSVGSYFCGPLAALYDATKVFDSFLAVGLHGEQKYLHKNKIDVLSLEPGGTETEFQSVAGSKGDNSRVGPSVVVDIALNAVLAGFPSIIPVHRDHFLTFSTWLPRAIYLPLILKAFSKIAQIQLPQ